MTREPRLEQRNERPYAAIRMQAPIPFGPILGPLWGEVNAWLAGRGLAPAGAPFVRYITTDMARKLDLEVGFPIAAAPLGAAASGNGRVSTGVFPAGRYAVLLYTGNYDGLVEATAGLLAWGAKNGVVWQTLAEANTEVWEARVEWYLTDPAAEPDPAKWQTELTFLVA